VDRGGAYRRGDNAKAFADFTSAISKQASLAGDVLAAVERRAAELSKDDKDAPQNVSALCRRGLEVVKPVLKDHADVDAALTAADKETDVRKRAALLRSAVTALRSKVEQNRNG
jgi:hypothetical protein